MTYLSASPQVSEFADPPHWCNLFSRAILITHTSIFDDWREYWLISWRFHVFSPLTLNLIVHKVVSLEQSFHLSVWFNFKHGIKSHNTGIPSENFNYIPKNRTEHWVMIISGHFEKTIISQCLRLAGGKFSKQLNYLRSAHYIVLYTRYPIVALGLAAAFRPSARASKGILHTIYCIKYIIINVTYYIVLHNERLRDCVLLPTSDGFIC